MDDDALSRAEARFHELMEQKVARHPDRYDWLDAAYMVALEQSEVGGSRWSAFVERVRPQRNGSDADTNHQ